MSALIVILKTPEKTETVKFVYEDGQLKLAIEQLAGYLVEQGAGSSVWEGVAGDRQAIILRQQLEIRDLRQWASMAGWTVKEMVT